MLEGEGIGPELCYATKQVLAAAGAPIEWEVVKVPPGGRVTEEVLESIKRNRVAMKGEFITGIGRNTRPALHVELCRKLGLYANVVHSFTMPGVPARHKDVDIVVIRENTEGEYSGLEHEVVPGITESLKIMTRDGTRRIAEYAFEYAYLNFRKKVTAVHKANIMKMADGLFLESCREVAKRYPSVRYDEIIVDNCMMQMVSKPQQFDVMVTPNLYGSLVSNAVAGLTGSPGLAPGANVGSVGAVFEQGVRHVGMDIAGKDLVNPTGALLSSAMMLRHLRLPAFADRVQSGVLHVLREGKTLTRDVGGNATTSDFVRAVIDHME